MAGLDLTTVSGADGQWRIDVVGEIDMTTAGQLTNAICAVLAQPEVSSIVVDLAEVEFCDSSGIAALIAGRNLSAAQDAAYAVVRPTGIVKAVLDISGATELLSA
jgi:anti-anti-sigma factor